MGQAKRAKVGVTVNSGIKWKAIMGWLSFVYITYITVVYCLVCPKGYIKYDMLKSKLFWIPSLIFCLCEIILWAVSLDNPDHFKLGYKEKKDKIDFAIFALFLTWGISTLISANRTMALWGDQYRYQGFMFFGLALAAMFLTSHIGGWNKISTGILMLVLSIVYVWQMLNYFGIVPFDWQMNRKFPLLVACLANIDQNSAFDGVAIAAGTAAFVFCKNKVIKALWGVVNVLCVMGAITTRSDSFYLGLAIGAVIIIGYSLKHAEYIRSTAVAMALYLVGILLVRALDAKYGYRAVYSIYWESAGSTLICSPRTIKLLAVLVVAFGVLAVFYPMLPKKVFTVVHYIYFVLLGGGGVAATAYLSNLYFSESESEIALFVREAFASRAPIWKYSFINMGYQNLAHRLFGVGFGNFNRIMDRYSSVVYSIRDYAELADAHNILIDFYVTTGVFGVIAWVTLLICLLVKFRRAAGHYPWAMVGVMLIAGLTVTGIVNTSLIIVTPWVYIGIGLMLYQVRLNEKPVVSVSGNEKETENTDNTENENTEVQQQPDKTTDVDNMEWAEVKKPKNSKTSGKRKKGKR